MIMSLILLHFHFRGLQNKIPLDDIVNNLFLELEKTEPLSEPQNTSRFTQPNVNVNTSIPSQNTTNNQHTTIPTNNSDNSLLHSNQHNNKMGTTEDILESSALGVELISHDPMTWGDRTLTEDAVLKILLLEPIQTRKHQNIKILFVIYLFRTSNSQRNSKKKNIFRT